MRVRGGRQRVVELHSSCCCRCLDRNLLWDTSSAAVLCCVMCARLLLHFSGALECHRIVPCFPTLSTFARSPRHPFRQRRQLTATSYLRGCEGAPAAVRHDPLMFQPCRCHEKPASRLVSPHAQYPKEAPCKNLLQFCCADLLCSALCQPLRCQPNHTLNRSASASTLCLAPSTAPCP